MSQADNGQWNCAIREGCCPVTGQLGQQMVIFPSTNTSKEEGWGGWGGGGAQLSGLSHRDKTVRGVHGNDSAITHKANKLDTDYLRVYEELQQAW